MSNYIYLNGEFFPEDKAWISVTDRGFLYGDGLFETLRVYNGVPFLLEEHLLRLKDGAGFLRIKLPEPPNTLENAVSETIKNNKITEGFLRLTISRGVTIRAVWPGETESQTVLITASSAVPYTAENYEKGFRAIPLRFPLNEKSPLSPYKTLDYLKYIIGRREAAEKGYDEGIFLNTNGYIAECTASNIFMVKGKNIYTPPLEAGPLPGITRGLVIKLASERYKILEDDISLSFLEEADEAFLTNSLMEIMPLQAVGAKIIGKAPERSVTNELSEAYKETVFKLTTLRS